MSFWYVRMVVMITFVSASWGVLVVGPKFIRSHQVYTLVISNFKETPSKVDLLLRLEAKSSNTTKIFTIEKLVDVRRYMSRIVSFEVPTISPPASIKMVIDGRRGYKFHEEENLVLLSKSISGLIQLDKPVYKPGDTVQFRVIVLDNQLKPPVQVKTVHVTIHDYNEIVIQHWASAKLYSGVFQNKLQIKPTHILGTWRISVLVDGEELTTKTFEVKEYVLSSFDVEIHPSVIPLEEHQGLNLTIAANYHFGIPAKGLARVELYLEDDELDQRKEIEVHGLGQVELRFNEKLILEHDQQNVRVKTTFIEKFTDRTVTKVQDISIYKYLYRARLEKDSEQFRPEIPFKCIFKLCYHDGSPAKKVPFSVQIQGDDVEHVQTIITDSKGAFELVLHPTESTEDMEITVSEHTSGFHFTEYISKVEKVTNMFLKLELKIKLNKMITLMVTCNTRLTFFIYYVISRGTILDTGLVRPNRQKKYQLQINASEKMMPKATVFIATVSNAIVVWDSLEIDFNQLSNHLELRIDEGEIKPGHEVKLLLKGRPNAYVWLAAYDKGLLQFSSNHDLFWKDVMQVFDDFHAVNHNEIDVFHSIGLFARISVETKLKPMDIGTKRVGSGFVKPFSKLVSYRTNFLESWLWQNVTIERSGKYTVIENVPDTTTSWYLTAFSIDPVYGLGIIKKPIQLTTIQPFYIVESLPYSIKRDEAVVLQFTLFNNLGGEYIANVTLYNVANQTEFVGRPVDELSYTKSVTVPPKVGVPISFLVKARKLGEMVVRVKASIMHGLETDALEKVILVMPEHIIRQNSVSRFFNMDGYGTQVFNISLDVLKQANYSTIKLEFILSPNLLTPVVFNLDNLLTVPTASGAPSMINFIPNLIVLDYLNAIGSNETDLINKARGLLRHGYQLEMQYRQRDGSFGSWRNSTGSIFVTALVGKSMQSASKYITEVDLNMVDQLFAWLASKQHRSGRFEEIAPITYNSLQDGSRNGIALTSYVLIAFLENAVVTTKHQEIVRKGIQYIAEHLMQITDVYDLSLATYALMLNDHGSKRVALEQLIKKSQTDSNGKRYWARETSSIETTAYGLLSLVHDKRYTDAISVMDWLVMHREVSGSFSRTQDTFVGLQAITMLTEAISPLKNDYSVSLMHGQNRKKFKIVSLHVAEEYRYDLMGDSKSVTVLVDGRGFGLFTIHYQYSIDVRHINQRFQLRLVPQFSNAGYTLQLQVCTTFEPVLSYSRSNLALVEVNFPSGYIVKRESVMDTTGRNPYKNVEFRYGQTSMVVYYDSLGQEENCFTVTANRLFRVAFQRSAYVLVHDSYNTGE
uniref:TEP1-F n=1 Tax=Anopheles minimus TaxID=112268 RepID=A0A182W9G4_9DIPT